jgi:hypothetical protein
MAEGIPPIYAGKTLRKRYPQTTVVQEISMKNATKTSAKSKQTSSAAKKFLPPMKAGNHMVGKQTVKPAKKC